MKNHSTHTNEEELKNLQQSRETYLQELENTNNENKIELEKRISDLSKREQELNVLKNQLKALESLAEESQVYLKNSEILIGRILLQLMLQAMYKIILFRHRKVGLHLHLIYSVPAHIKLLSTNRIIENIKKEQD